MEVEPVKKITLTEQIMQEIASQITSGQLKPGEKLPNERALGEMFNVTRSRIREALRALSLIGLITIKPGDGSFVNEEGIKIPDETLLWIYHQEIHNHDEIYAARKLIETEVYLTCFDHRTPDIISRITSYGDVLFDADINEISSDTFYTLISDIDHYVGSACGNNIYNKLMQTMVLLRKESAMKILALSTSRASAIYYRKKIIDCFHQDDREKLKKALDDFFKYSIQSITIDNSASIEQ